MEGYQGGVLGPLPPHGRYLTFRLTAPAQAKQALKILAGIANGENCVVGLGQSLIRALDRDVPGFKPFPVSASKTAPVPATPSDLWCWLRGTSRGDLFEL